MDIQGEGVPGPGDGKGQGHEVGTYLLVQLRTVTRAEPGGSRGQMAPQGSGLTKNQDHASPFKRG